MVDKPKLVAALAKSIPQQLATDLVDDFLQLRQDVATSTLGRASGGKIIETVVQILQQLESGKHDAKPNVDGYLLQVENKTTLDEGFAHLCCPACA